MIRKAKNRGEDIGEFFVVLDIENDPDGNVIDIGTFWRDYATNEDLFHVHNSWADWWSWYYRLAREDKAMRTIYAHNGGGWDWLSLAQWLLENRQDDTTVTGITAGSSLVVLNVRVKGKFTIRFCDSLQLLRSSLDKLATTFLGEGKIDSGGILPHELKQKDEAKYYDYLRRDCEALCSVLEKSLSTIRENVADIDSFGPTIGSTAMKVFRHMVDEPITIPMDDDFRDFLRKGYKGGRVEAFRKGYFSNVKVYDINSLYPSIMFQQKVPLSDRTIEVGSYRFGHLGVYECSYNQRRRDIPPVLVDGGEGSYRGSGVFYSPELDLLREVDPDAVIDVYRGHLWIDTGFLFAEYVEKLYNLRMKDRSGPLGLLCKFLLNSLYGKFGQHPIREQLVIINEFQDLWDLIEEGASVTEINDNVYSLEKESRAEFEHVGIAGTVTSAARAALYRGVLDAGADRVIYCDTDSVHTTGDLPDDLMGDSLGEYKLEFTGEGVYCGKKLYALRSPTQGEKIRSKGVSLGGRNGASLCFDDLRRVAEGSSIVCEFQRPSTPREVFRGGESCKFLPRKRTIRMT